MKNKKTLVAVLGILGIIFATVGVTYAFFSYSRAGAKVNKLKSGNITFHYMEVSQGISIGDVMPMKDIQGKAQSNYFDFTVKSKTSDTVDIPYYITAIRSGTGTNMDGIVKVYLTKVDDQGNETEVALSKFSELGTYTNSDGINIPLNEKLLYQTRVYAGDKNYTQKYRLRMWIDKDAQLLVQTEVAAHCVNTNNETVATIPEVGEANQINCTNTEGYTWVAKNVISNYPYEGKTYTIKVNVYGSGEETTQSQREFRENVELENVEIGNNVVTSSTTTLTESEIMPAGETRITKTITVNTVNPDATVTVENLTPTSSLIEKNNIKRVSTNLTLDLILGTNTFKLTVFSPNKSKSKEYTLIVNTAYPSYDVSLLGNNVTFESDNLAVQYGSSNTVSVTPTSGYYLSTASCTNGYTTNAATGTNATGSQTITISNNNNVGTSICTFTVTPVTYSITYDTNGGAQGANPRNSYTVEDETFSLPTPTKDNYDFDGWCPSHGSCITEIVTGTTGNLELQAKWLIKTYTVKFNGSGATSGSMNDQEFRVGVEQNLTANAYQKDGYNFKGWATTNGSSTVAYTNSQAVVDLTTVRGATVNLYAVWEKAPKVLFENGPANGYEWTTASTASSCSNNLNTGVFNYCANYSWIVGEFDLDLTNVSFSGYSNIHMIVSTGVFSDKGNYLNSTYLLLRYQNNTDIIKYQEANQDHVQLNASLSSVVTGSGKRLRIIAPGYGSGPITIHKVWVD